MHISTFKYHAIGLCMAKLHEDYAPDVLMKMPDTQLLRPTINLLSLVETESQIVRLYASHNCVV